MATAEQAGQTADDVPRRQRKSNRRKVVDATPDDDLVEAAIERMTNDRINALMTLYGFTSEAAMAMDMLLTTTATRIQERDG